MEDSDKLKKEFLRRGIKAKGLTNKLNYLIQVLDGGNEETSDYTSLMEFLIGLDDLINKYLKINLSDDEKQTVLRSILNDNDGRYYINLDTAMRVFDTISKNGFGWQAGDKYLTIFHNSTTIVEVEADGMGKLMTKGLEEFLKYYYMEVLIMENEV